MKPNLLPAGLALFLAAGVQASAQTPSVGNDQPSIKLRVRIPDNATGTQFTVKSSQGFTSVKMDPRVRITLLPATNPLPPGSNADGFNESGIHQDTGTAYNPGGFNAKGFNSTGIHQATGTLYDSAGFNAAGFNNSGFNATGIHQATGTLYDSAGFNAAGFNNSGFNATGIH
ncbi:MAG: hypothetical protein P4L36_06820, partial [Holophaga sp.]|nr:hypothetical protein [Holophaga sp.]